jgi:hypothetical protein
LSINSKPKGLAAHTLEKLLLEKENKVRLFATISSTTHDAGGGIKLSLHINTKRPAGPTPWNNY